MSRHITASDRSCLIRLASTLPVGSPERKTLLASLTVQDKVAMGSATVSAFLTVASSKLTQYDQKLEAKQPSPYRLGHYLGALERVRQDVSSVLESSSPEALALLKKSFAKHFVSLAPINATVKQIDQYLQTGKAPSLVR